MNEPRVLMLRCAVADVLLTLSAGYIGLTTFGGMLWFPYDLSIAILLGVLAWRVGDYKHRWWPVAPMRDREHEVKIERDTTK